MYNVVPLLGWSLFGLIVLLIWQRVAPEKWRLGWGGSADKRQLSLLTVIFAVLLTITVIFFFNQIWNDLSEVVGPSPYGWSGSMLHIPPPGMYGTQMDYADSGQAELQRLFLHTIFVIGALIVAFTLFISSFRKNIRYTALTLPYFVGSMVITIRLLFDAGSWAIRYHQRFGIYIVLGALLLVFSFLTVYVQKWWQQHQEQPHE